MAKRTSEYDEWGVRPGGWSYRLRRDANRKNVGPLKKVWKFMNKRLVVAVIGALIIHGAVR